MATQYVDAQGKFFQNPLVVEGRMIFNPTEEQLVSAGYTVYTPEQQSQRPRVYRFSKYKIKQLLGPEGWELKKQELMDSGLWDDFSLCDHLSTDDALFGPIWEELGTEERKLLIKECQF